MSKKVNVDIVEDGVTVVINGKAYRKGSKNVKVSKKDYEKHKAFMRINIPKKKKKDKDGLGSEKTV